MKIKKIVKILLLCAGVVTAAALMLASGSSPAAVDVVTLEGRKVRA